MDGLPNLSPRTWVLVAFVGVVLVALLSITAERFESARRGHARSRSQLEPEPPPLPKPEPTPSEKMIAAGLPPCDDFEFNRAVDTAVTRFEGRDLFMHPFAWGRAEFNVRTNLLFWISTCRFSGEKVRVRHLMTGKELASWSRAWGYESSE